VGVDILIARPYLRVFLAEVLTNPSPEEPFASADAQAKPFAFGPVTGT